METVLATDGTLMNTDKEKTKTIMRVPAEINQIRVSSVAENSLSILVRPFRQAGKPALL
jgi:hypothetical protein